MKKSDLIEKIKETMQEDNEIKFVLLETLEKNPYDELCDEEVLSYMEFIMGNYQAEKTKKVVELNKQVSVGINELSRLGKWANLTYISDHALDACVKCLKHVSENDTHNKDVMDEMVEHFEAKLWFSRLHGPIRLKIYREYRN